MNEIELYLYQPRPAAVAVLATLRANLPPTEEHQINDARVLLRGDLGHQPEQALRRALQQVERLHPMWRQLLSITAVDGRLPAL